MDNDEAVKEFLKKHTQSLLEGTFIEPPSDDSFMQLRSVQPENLDENFKQEIFKAIIILLNDFPHHALFSR